MATLLISLFGCFQKKEKKNNLSSWLETNFPGQLEIVGDVIDLDPRRLFDHKKSTILTDKSDPEVQIKVTWYKDQDSLGVNVDGVKALLDSSRKDTQAARHYFKALSDSGLTNISVGVIDMALYVLVFEDPTPDVRKKYLEKILATLDAQPVHEQTSIWIECMEPAVYQGNFKDIIPYGYWHRGDNYHREKTIMALDFEWSEGLDAGHLMPHWSINNASERSSVYRNEAYNDASAWAAKNIPSPFYLEPAQMVQVGPVDEDPMAIEFSFPYFESKPDTEQSGFEDSALGYVVGVYQVDQKTFSKIKKVKEL